MVGVNFALFDQRLCFAELSSDDFSGVHLVMLKDARAQNLCLLTIRAHTETRLHVTVAGGPAFSLGPESKDNLLLTEWMFNLIDTHV